MANRAMSQPAKSNVSERKCQMKQITNKLINGPISKKNFLKKEYSGITEYIANKVGPYVTVLPLFYRALHSKSRAFRVSCGSWRWYVQDAAPELLLHAVQ